MRRKIFFSLIMVIIFLCINTKTVKATILGIIKEENINTQILSNIPNEIKLDIKEIEFEQAERMVFDKIVSELAKQNITVKEEGIEKEVQGNYKYIEVSISNLKEAFVSFNLNKKALANKVEEIEDKTISLKYSNSSGYNEDDRNIVQTKIEQIDLPKDEEGYAYIITEYVELESETPKIEEFAKNVLKEKINDDKIEIVCRYVSVDMMIFKREGRIQFSVFKDGIYYNDLYISYVGKYKITVPSKVEDTEEAYVSYALPKVQQYIKSVYETGSYGEYDDEETYYLKKMRRRYL